MHVQTQSKWNEDVYQQNVNGSLETFGEFFLSFLFVGFVFIEAKFVLLS